MVQAWKRHVDLVRMGMLKLAILTHLGSVDAAWRDVAPLIHLQIILSPGLLRPLPSLPSHPKPRQLAVVMAR